MFRTNTSSSSLKHEKSSKIKYKTFSESEDEENPNPKPKTSKKEKANKEKTDVVVVALSLLGDVLFSILRILFWMWENLVKISHLIILNSKIITTERKTWNNNIIDNIYKDIEQGKYKEVAGGEL